MYPYNFIHYYFNSDIVDTKPESVFARLEIDKRSGLKTGNIPHDVYSDIMGFEMDFSKTAAENTDLILSKTENFSGQDKSHSLGLFFEFIFKTGDYKFVIDSFHLLNDKLDSGDIQFDPRAYYYIASAMLAMDMCVDAIRLIDEAIENYQSKSYVFISLKGQVFRTMQKFWLAADCFVLAVNIEPNYPEPSWALKFLHSVLNKSKCQSIYAKIKGNCKKNSPDYLYGMLADMAYHAGYVEESKSILRTQVRNMACKKISKIGGEVLSSQLDEPDFIIIGMQKCGTTSLHAYLSSRADVISATTKEIGFFGYNYQRGVDWYRSTFPHVIDAHGERLLTGEASPGYVYNMKALQRIKDHTRDTKLIMMMRDPVLRTISSYYQKKKMQGIDTPLHDYIRNLLTDGNKSHLLRESIYIDYIKVWMDAFGKSRLLLLNADNLFAEKGELRKVTDFLSLSDSGMGYLPHANKGSYPATDQVIIDKLSHFYKPHNEKLYNYMSCDFGWL